MNASRKTALPILFYLLTMIFLYALSRTLHPVPGGDDEMFSNILKNKNLFTLIYERYLGWSGRITIEMLLIKTINIKIFWKAAIPLSILLLAYSAWKLFFFDIVRPYIAIPTGIMFFMLITPSVNADAAWWITGFYNYLLPVSCGAWSLVVLKNSATSHLSSKIIALMLLSISCFSEQVAILMITAAICIYFTKQNRKKYDIVFISLCLILTGILLTAPGNAQRYAFEIKNSLPEFSSFNIIDKLMLGLDRLNHHLNDPENIIVNILLLMTIAIAIRQKNLSSTDLVGIAFLIIKLCGFLLCHANLTMSEFIYNQHFFNAASWFGYKIYTSFFFTLASVFSLILLSYKFIDDNKTAIVSVVSLLAGCATVMMMSFSPTVYASAQRILFAYEICSLVALCAYVRHFLLSKSRK